MIELLPVRYYTMVFYWTMFAICVLTSLYYQASPGCVKLYRKNSLFLPFLWALVLIVYIGLRPCSWVFMDMMLYRHLWGITDASSIQFSFNLRSEWFFTLVTVVCKNLVPDVQFWFLILELIYIGCQFWACKKLMWENVWLAIMFVFLSYQFYAYGTNGLRNGLATAILMLSISFFCDRNKIGFLIGSALFIMAMGCHRSVVMPMAAVLVSLFVIKDIKYAVYIWLGCIVISLFSGNIFLNFLSGLGFDNRMESYTNASERVMSTFSHTGFRWDFLIYSAMPVWLAWYVRRLGIQDKTFSILANTYIIANSFWILVCRVAFSNRFAYLSWFMYALVLAYAVIRIPIWKNQDRVAGQILLAHSLFTIIMFVIGK